jgi:DNA invertase Pin-like site-specific DNA recombinase
VPPTRRNRQQSRLLGYLRTHPRLPDPTLQHDALLAAGCERVWADIGCLPPNQPALADLCAQSRPGDTLVIWRLDRVATTLDSLIHTINDLIERNLHLRSLSEGIDCTAPDGMSEVFAHVDAFQADRQRERAHIGLAAARAQGRLGGRPRALTEQGRERATALLFEGFSVADIAAALRVSRATIYRHIATIPPATAVSPDEYDPAT